jgi:hypothetical protein
VAARISSYVAQNRIAVGASLALSLMLLQFAVIATSPYELPVRIVLPLTIGLAPVALWPLRRHPGVWVMFVGLAANLAAILANGGLMPIERSTVVDGIGAERAAEYRTGTWIAGSKDVLVRDGGGRVTALGDSIIVRMGDRGFAASPGDVVVWCGVLLLIAEASWRWQRSLGNRARSEEKPPARAEASARAEGSAPTPQ